MKTSWMKMVSGVCACVCAVLCTGVAWGATTVKTLSLRRDLSDNRITLDSTTLATGFDGNLASSTLASYIKQDTTTTPTTAYQWYCYPGSYSLSADLTLSLWSFGIYLNTAETTYDCRGKTLNLGGAGISFVSSTAAKQDVYLTYKGGTWDFSSVTGSGGKLVGNGAESMIVKPKDTSTGVATTDKTKWYTSGNYTKQHGVVDGATIYKPNCSFYLLGGNINSTLEFKNSAQFTTEKDLFLSHYTLDSIAFGAGGNTLTIGGGSKVTCPQFYTDTSGASTVPLSVNGTAIVKDTGSSLVVANTLFLGAVVGGNTIQVKDGAYVKASTSGTGSGICLGVNHANSCSNTLEIADGGHVTIGSDSSRLSLSIGHSNGSSGNKVIVREGGSLTASYVKLDANGDLTAGYNGDDNSFIAEAGSTVSLSATTQPFQFYGNNSKISLATGNGSATTAWSYVNVFDMTAKVSKSGDAESGYTYTLQGCTNNTLEILNGTTFNMAKELKLGEQNDATKVTYPYVPSIGSTIVVGNEATLNVASQVFCAGPRNTLVLSNGTLNCNYQSAYAFYWGDTRCVTLGQGSEGNKIVLYGNKPQLKTQTAQCSSGYPCISFGGTTEIDVNLPETLAYEKIPFVCGRFVLERGCRFKIPNIDKIYEAMAKGAQTSVSFTLAEATTFSGCCTTDNASELPSTCSLSVVDVKNEAGEATGTKQLVLTVAHAFSGGSGTSADPYLLGTVDDMKELQTLLADGTDYTGKYFKQTADITLTDWEGIGVNYAGGSASPYNAFTGIYDGNGKKVTVTIKEDGTDRKYYGLFNTIRNGTVKNLNVEINNTTAITGTEEVGMAALVGTVDGASVIQNCTVSGAIVSSHNCGGLCVKALGTTQIIGCTSTVDITTSGTKAGGIVSFYQQENASNVLTIKNCVNEGSVSSSASTTAANVGVGGIIGWSKNNLVLDGVKNTGAITWTQNSAKAGEIIGAIGDASTTVSVEATCCSWVNDTTTKGYGTLLSSEEKATVTGLGVATSLGDGIKAQLQNGVCSIIGSGTLTTNMVTTLGKNNITSLTLGDGITGVAEGAFEKSFNLKSVTFNSTSAVTLADYAFYRCNSITEMNFAAMPTLGENSIVMQAAIKMVGGEAQVWAIPEINVNGYRTALMGATELKGAEADWTEVTPANKSQFHFFKLQLVANSQN